MGSSKKNKRKLKEKLLHKYRMVILNEDTFEERFSFKLSKFNMIILTLISSLLLIFATVFLIAFTPVREYIPGYSSTALKNKATRLTLEVDSLTSIVDRNSAYFASIRNVLSGKNDALDTEESYTLKDNTRPVDVDSVNLTASQEDSILRVKVEQEDKYSLVEKATFSTNFTLFPPVTGRLSETYDADKKHYGVDVVTSKNEPVKAALDGTVIFSEWTVETGYVVIIEHNFGLISVYKHNQSLLKNQGDLVTSGEAIAVVGNTGEYSYGPHLHFELWVDGYPVNPTDYINFEN